MAESPLGELVAQLCRIADALELLSAKKAKPRTAAPDAWGLAQRHMTTSILATPEFKAAWEAWDAVRRQVHHKPITDMVAKTNVPRLEAVGHDEAVRLLQSSVENEWRKIVYDPLNRSTGGSKTEFDKWLEGPDADEVNHARG